MAKQLGVSDALMSLVLSGDRPISNEMARRLATEFPETTPGYWIDIDLKQLQRMIDQWSPRPEIR
jgi:plasmid maintenance system antidote protein VapI